MLSITNLMRSHASLADQANLVPSLLDSPDLALTGNPVRTVGVFYYRACNGGAEQVLCHLIRLWCAAGYRVVLLTDFPADPKDYPLPESVRRYVLPDTFALTEESRIARYDQLQKILKAEQVDAFVHHAWLSRNMLWDLLAVKTLGIPFVIYTHGVFSCLLSEGNLPDMDELPHLAKIYRLANRVICLSDTIATFWNRFAPSTSVLLNPCRVAEPAPDAPASRDPDLLLWVGRIAPEKQPDEAIRILAEARKSRPATRLQIVGAADAVHADYERQVVALAASLGVADAVSFEGFHADVTPYYRRASVLLLTSGYEGFCLSIAEAKTCGLPCVMYSLPYLYFAENPTGLFSVPQKDAVAAAEKVLALLNDPAALEKAGQDALAGAAVFSDARLTGQWSALFSALPDAVPAEHPTNADTVMLETLLDHLHQGLRIAEQKAAGLERSAAGGMLDSVFNAAYYAARYPDVNKSCKGNDLLLLEHFLSKGMRKGFQGCASFDPVIYRDRYPDLRQALGKDLASYYLHYLLHGRQEGRSGC